MTYRQPPEPTSWTDDLPDQLGREALQKGKVAVVLLAGGVGSRLGWDGPKGTFPVTPVRNHTLFQLFADKIKAAEKCYGHSIPVAVLTSKGNTEGTIKAFQGKTYSFCEQTELPYLDEKNQPLPFFGPDGNGGVFKVLEDQGVLQKWEDEGVELLTTVLIENPLADPVDARWIDFHLRGGFDLTLKVVRKSFPDEKVGLLVEKDGKLNVVEYNELDQKEGFDLANISLLLMNITFARKAAKNTHNLPLHLQWKKINEGQWGWKQERYIFDHFPLAEKIGPLLYPREKTFVPLKERNDLEKVQRALSFREREILKEITNGPVDDAVQEIDPQFYYPTEGLKAIWKGKNVGIAPYVNGDGK